LCLSYHCPWILNSWLLICKVWSLTDTQHMRGRWSKVQFRSTCCCLIWWPASHSGGALNTFLYHLSCITALSHF
jgi:hypothetical protein